jgi:hypothetical protein
MAKTNALIKAIIVLLNPLIDKVSYDEGIKSGTDTKEYPYAVFDIVEIPQLYDSSLYQLEVNVVGYGSVKSSIETICDEIQKEFDHYYHNDENIQFAIYLGIRNSVKEDDKKIIRRRMLFEIHLHEKGE